VFNSKFCLKVCRHKPIIHHAGILKLHQRHLNVHYIKTMEQIKPKI